MSNLNKKCPYKICFPFKSVLGQTPEPGSGVRLLQQVEAEDRGQIFRDQLLPAGTSRGRRNPQLRAVPGLPRGRGQRDPPHGPECPLETLPHQLCRVCMELHGYCKGTVRFLQVRFLKVRFLSVRFSNLSLYFRPNIPLAVGGYRCDSRSYSG